MPLRADLFDLPAPEGARRLARQLLADARDAARRLHDPADGEALHDFRVAVRRLRSTLRAYRPVLADTVKAKRRRQLGAVARASGAARDAEVHLGWTEAQRGTLAHDERVGAAWLADRLAERRETHGARLLDETLAGFARIGAALDEELGRYEATVRLDVADPVPTLATCTAALLADAGDELARRLAAATSVDLHEEAHRARIAGKRLRYLLEPVAAVLGDGQVLVAELRELQDALGDLHDAHVFARELLDASDEADGAAEARPGLLALAARVRARGDAAWGEAERRWVSGGAAELLAAVRALADRLAAREHEDVEIERKYLLTALPDAARAAPCDELAQGYLPGTRLIERVRSVRAADGTTTYYRTVKGGRGVRRLEIEDETTEAVFTALWALTEGRRVHKRRYRVEAGSRTWEIDEFVDRSLWLAEIELGSADEAVEIPTWLAPYVAREVTEEPGYGNYALAR